jgi:hypothetical protein
MVLTPPGRHRWHRKSDLDLGGGPGEFRKNQKNGKTVHGVMVSDALHRKNTKHAIPEVHMWKNYNGVHLYIFVAKFFYHEYICSLLG